MDIWVCVFVERKYSSIHPIVISTMKVRFALNAIVSVRKRKRRSLSTVKPALGRFYSLKTPVCQA